MTRSLTTVLTLGAAILASAAESRPTPPVDEVSQAAIQSAFQILRRDYIRRDDLSLDQLNRAALLGLLERLSFGAELVKNDPTAASPENKVEAEMLTTNIACLRPHALADKEVAPMRSAIDSFKQKGVRHLVLDLRSPAAPGEFETAAAILELFLPKGTLLFKLKQLGSGDAQPMISRLDPAWTGSLVVLVDNEANNLSETVAAVLRQQKRATLIGSPTRGATVRYETAPIEAGWKLRFARAEVLLPDDTSVFPKGLKPDFAVALPGKIKHELFALSDLKSTIFETARARFNEAALVSGKNPELDDYIRRSGGEVMTYDTTHHFDAVLQRAVDSLMTSDHLETAKLDWGRGSAIEPQDNVKAVRALQP